jgi:hypothetical protein
MRPARETQRVFDAGPRVSCACARCAASRASRDAALAGLLDELAFTHRREFASRAADPTFVIQSRQKVISFRNHF